MLHILAAIYLNTLYIVRYQDDEDEARAELLEAQVKNVKVQVPKNHFRVYKPKNKLPIRHLVREWQSIFNNFQFSPVPCIPHECPPPDNVFGKLDFPQIGAVPIPR